MLIFQISELQFLTKKVLKVIKLNMPHSKMSRVCKRKQVCFPNFFGDMKGRRISQALLQ